jgi:hypothetical protein
MAKNNSFWENAAGPIASVGGSIISGMSQPDQYAPAQPRSYTGLLNPEQIGASDQLLQMLMAGGGDFGSGAATRQANATLMDQLARKGINPNSKYAGSVQGQMLGSIAGQDATRRGSMLLQLLSQRGNPLNYQNLGYGYGGMTGWGEGAARADAMLPSTGVSHFDNVINSINEQIARQSRSGGTYMPQKVG